MKVEEGLGSRRGTLRGEQDIVIGNWRLSAYIIYMYEMS